LWQSQALFLGRGFEYLDQIAQFVHFGAVDTDGEGSFSEVVGFGAVVDMISLLSNRGIRSR
jgi:hypothetical protein